jgi:hypothetical protein
VIPGCNPVRKPTKMTPASFVMLVLLSTGTLSRAHGGDNCGPDDWTRPEVLRGPNNSAIYVETPQVLRQRDTLWLLGSARITQGGARRVNLFRIT